MLSFFWGTITKHAVSHMEDFGWLINMSHCRWDHDTHQCQLKSDSSWGHLTFQTLNLWQSSTFSFKVLIFLFVLLFKKKTTNNKQTKPARSNILLSQHTITDTVDYYYLIQIVLLEWWIISELLKIKMSTKPVQLSFCERHQCRNNLASCASHSRQT